jgi:Mrp family chromosome partitioning ATPase
MGSGGIELVEAGPLAESPWQSNGSGAMERFLESARGRVDLVLVDAPAVLGASDALGLAPVVDGLLLVAAAGRTRRRALAEARLELDRMRANVVGCILTNFEAGRSRPGW